MKKQPIMRVTKQDIESYRMVKKSWPKLEPNPPDFLIYRIEFVDQ